jgi:hypothetical protein
VHPACIGQILGYLHVVLGGRIFFLRPISKKSGYLAADEPQKGMYTMVETLKATLLFAAALLAGLFLFPQELHAYIDPGTGSYLVQVVIASVVGGIFALKMYWFRVKLFFKGVFFSKSKGEEQP